jgi:hypothetical protein
MEAKLTLAVDLGEAEGEIDAYMGQAVVFDRLGQQTVRRRLIEQAAERARSVGMLSRAKELTTLLAAT